MGLWTTIKKAYNHPRLAGQRLNQLYFTRGHYRKYNPNGMDIFAGDWDNLIILDACRYDMLKESVDPEQDVKKRLSRGSSTAEWLRGNVASRTLLDTVYITANPQLTNLQPELGADFHRVYNLWETDWEKDVETVPPKTTANRVREIAPKHPQKRRLIHFIQPHLKFLGPSAAQLPSPQNALWHRIMRGQIDVDHDLLSRAYRENLDLVLDQVWPLVDDLEGKTAISSDHGNFVGERITPVPVRHYGHPSGVYREGTVLVPWLELDTDSRREIIKGDSINTGKQGNDATVSDRLDALGYIDS